MKRPAITPESLGRVCELRSLEDWNYKPRPGRAARKLRLRKWVQLANAEGTLCILDYRTLKWVLESVRRLPVQLETKRTHIRVIYPRGCIRLYLRDSTTATRVDDLPR
jgi:hypothetical protein